MPRPFTKPEDFFLGVLVGIYGNWLISFLDRVTFPLERNYVFYIQLGLVITSFFTFFFYLMFAYIRIFYPSIFWIIHSILPLITFIFQNSFVKDQPELLSKNIVFWATGFPILCLILFVEFISMGRYHEYILKKRWKEPITIGILNDMGWDLENNETYAWTDVSPEKWESNIKSLLNVRVELIDVKSSFDKYVAVLNPYGGVYPEIDLNDLSTLKKILNYVGEGGIFVNIADIPSYWAYNQDIGRRLDTTSPIYDIEDNQIKIVRPFVLTPLAKQLGIRIFNVDGSPQLQDFSRYSESEVDIVSRRIAIVESNMEPCIPPTSIKTNIGDIKTSAFISVKYGEGDFIFSIIFINDERHNELAKNTILKGIVETTVDKLRKKISSVKKN